MTDSIKNAQDLVKGFQEFSNAKIEEEAAKGLQTAIVETCAEKHDMEKGEWKAAAEVYFKKNYYPEKYEKEREKVESKYEIVDSVSQ